MIAWKLVEKLSFFFIFFSLPSTYNIWGYTVYTKFLYLHVLVISIISLSTFNTLDTRYFILLRYLEHQDLKKHCSGPLFSTMGNTYHPIDSLVPQEENSTISMECDSSSVLQIADNDQNVALLSKRVEGACVNVPWWSSCSRFGMWDILGPVWPILMGGRRCDMFEQSSPQWDRIDTKGLMFSPGWMKFNDLLVPGHFGHLF